MGRGAQRWGSRGCRSRLHCGRSVLRTAPAPGHSCRRYLRGDRPVKAIPVPGADAAPCLQFLEKQEDSDVPSVNAARAPRDVRGSGRMCGTGRAVWQRLPGLPKALHSSRKPWNKTEGLPMTDKRLKGNNSTNRKAP